jgi:hypothetical protein
MIQVSLLNVINLAELLNPVNLDSLKGVLRSQVISHKSG